MEYLGFSALLVVAMVLNTVGGLMQHRYYVRTVRRLASQHNKAGCFLVSGRTRGRFRGAIAILVLRTDDDIIDGAAVMEGASVLARFKDRPDWVGLSAIRPLPHCSPRLAAAVAQARTRVPGRTATSAMPAPAPIRRRLGWGR